MLRHLFFYRFSKGLGLNGHSFGNLFLTALTEITGSTESAIAEAGRTLGIKGQVLTVTLTNSQLCARLVDGTEIIGEADIDVRKEKPDVRMDYLFLDPKAFVHPSVVTAMESADAIVIGPGDLYTSIIPNLLVDGVPEAIAGCKGPKIYACNLMTIYGESDGFQASDFIREVQEYLGSLARLDYTIVNSTPFPEKALNRYRLEKAFPVEVDAAECEKLVPHVVEAPLLSPGALLPTTPIVWRKLS